MTWRAAPSPVDAGDLRFVPLDERHLRLLHEWLTRPHVARWWGPASSVDELRLDYLAHADAGDATRAYIAYLGAEPVGFIQCYVVMGSPGGWWPGETDPGARGIDQFLADGRRLGQGLGSAMVKAFVQALFEDSRVTMIQTDPDPDNQRAIRCYRRAGVRDVGRITTPDGPALLMRCART
jgi:RimJ/RimL family protein N-acetyltransferase